MAQTRDDALARAEGYVDHGGFEADLAALVAHRSESQRADSAAGLRAYLVAGVGPLLERAGFTCRVAENPDPAGGPFLVAHRQEGAGLPRLLHYGHGDTVDGQAGAWRAGDPFVLRREGARLYGRGAADNKGQHLMNIAAMQAVIGTRGALGFNATWVIETSEETGSPGLAAFFARERAALAADLLIASDGPRLRADTPTIFTGTRGVVNFTLEVDLREGAHHSGNWGGLLADPAIVLAHALATITDARGAIAVPEWRPGSLTDEVRRALRDLPVGDADGPALAPDWGEPGLTPAERVFGWNSFAVLAMQSGTPAAPVNAIAGSARATCQLRFVVGTDAQDILPALRRHLDRHGFGAVRVAAADTAAMAATRAAPDDPRVAFVAASLRRTTGKAPHVLPNLGGSLPNGCFTDTLGLATIWIPHGHAGCNQHAPDEHLRLDVAREGLRAMTGLWWDIGAGGLPAA